MIDLRDLTDRVPPILYRPGGRDPDGRGVDCWWVVLEVQRRLGRAMHADADVDPDGRPDGVALADWLARGRARWPTIDAEAATRPGDVLLWAGAAGEPPHAVAVVGALPGGQTGVVSAFRRGGVRVVPLNVYSRTRDAAPISAHRYAP